MSKLLLVLAALITSLGSLAHAQRTVAVGDTLKVKKWGSRSSVRGVAEFIDQDSVVLRRTNGKRQTLPRSTSMFPLVLEGRRPQVAQGAMIGLTAGMAVGLLASTASGASIDGWLEIDSDETAFLAGLAGGVGGAFIGMLIGATAKGHRWVPGRFEAPPASSNSILAAVRPAPVVRLGAESSVLVGVLLRR